MSPLFVPLPKKSGGIPAKEIRRTYGRVPYRFREAYPGYQPKDLVDVDFVFRPGAVEQAKLKAAQQGAPVYMYMFAWESPVLDGMFRSTHCMDIPFAFNNVVRHASMTGGGAEAQALGEKMSSAWLNFARTAIPMPKGYPSGNLIPQKREQR